jgi:hypothetical protein
MLIYNEDDALAQWIGRQLGGIRFSPPYCCIGVARGAELLAAVLYNNFEPPNIQITFVTTSPRWASRQVIGRILGYPFRELGCRRISAITPARNKQARAFMLRLGFNEEGHHPDYFENDAGVSYGLLKRNAQKWLEIFDVESAITTRSSRSLHDGEGGITGEHPERDRQLAPE